MKSIKVPGSMSAKRLANTIGAKLGDRQEEKEKGKNKINMSKIAKELANRRERVEAEEGED